MSVYFSFSGGDFFSGGQNPGGSLAIPMYGLSFRNYVAEIKVSQIWYADDASAREDLHGLHCWWDKLFRGYFPNPIKTCLKLKPSLVRLA